MAKPICVARLRQTDRRRHASDVSFLSVIVVLFEYSHSLVLAEAATATSFIRALPLVFTDATAAAVFTLAPPCMATRSH